MMSPLRHRIHEIIFEADTPAGKLFDVALIASIVCSVLTVMLDSMPDFHMQYGQELEVLEFSFTALFSIEYLLRLWCVKRPASYAFSFYGIIDLLSVLPTWLSLLIPATQFLAVLRILRVLRVFRVLKLLQYIQESTRLLSALKASSKRITVFFFWVVTLVILFGSLMYVIEGQANGFNSIPHSIYWAIVTLTTVGYGDISPKTGLGQAVASLVMVLGYSIIAVPTGIVSAEFAKEQSVSLSTQACPNCGEEEHAEDALYCKTCGEKL